MNVPAEATIAAYGDIATDRREYEPLDAVKVAVTGRRRGPAGWDGACRLRVLDASGRAYFQADMALKEGRGEAVFRAAGSLGVHRVFLEFPGEPRHSRFACFLLDCGTSVRTGDPAFDGLIPRTREALRLNRREYRLGERAAEQAMKDRTDRGAERGLRGTLVGYVSADTSERDGIWLRDSLYTLPAFLHWEARLVETLDRYLEGQDADGSVPDGIRLDGSTWKMPEESDNEYILTLGIRDVWKITGDDAWMGHALPAAERALAFATGGPERWDAATGLARRYHTCDTWDFGMRVDGREEKECPVAATCDQTGYYEAFRAMEEMHRALGHAAEAEGYARRAKGLRERANDILWGGRFYMHHKHLVPMEHPGFDESAQLAMGNVWAVTRGLADGQRALPILDEYRRRETATGDAFPWWSLQPGYPDALGYFNRPFLRQGGYANGGLMPFVGGELCRACFQAGRESYGVKLLRQYVGHLDRGGDRVHVWYWPDGTPGFRTPNEVPHTGWGMAQWMQAFVEGLAGIRDLSTRLADVEASPRWAATDREECGATVRYAANDAYFSYRMRLERREKRCRILFAGSGRAVRFRLLLPDGWEPRSLTVDGAPVPFAAERVGEGAYVAFDASTAGVRSAEVCCG